MQTILGANGQIGRELARELKQNFTSDIRLVSRNPQKINDTDTLMSANLLDADQTRDAVAGSDIVYLTAGLPMDTERWIREWPPIMKNVIDACAFHKVKLVYFDNTYMYPQTDTPQTEDTPFKPHGDKGRIRGAITGQLLEAMSAGRVEALICRAPEFYGPGQTQSIINGLVLDALVAGKKPKVFLRDDTKRTLIYTPDASRAMALLGNTPDAYGQTWHLPCDDNRPTYKEFIRLAADAYRRPYEYTVLKPWLLWIAAKFNPQRRDASELLPRYKQDNIFVSDKFKKRFPDFKVTTFSEGLKATAAEQKH
ncbi:NAD-dependent epimerase/dehydratase family protein [uncultured Thalassolituus sp.]|uniref:NAD-dependent epimerase/dehydratase family protein n=1 Tax=uncultured Thalassolituus sp. TaxID=285273 RepID=UPI0026163BAB|nr:NAD-dependent epimerase/dehydratase family protein [uncultured Thalassolituus sp.]